MVNFILLKKLRKQTFRFKFFSFNNFFKDIFIFRERGGEGEREGVKHQCVVACCVSPTGDVACNPGMCPRSGIELATHWFTGQHSIHWATPARAKIFFLMILVIYFREGGRKGERGRETLIICLSYVPWLGDWTQNPGMCSDRESNRQPFALWDHTQTT